MHMTCMLLLLLLVALKQVPSRMCGNSVSKQGTTLPTTTAAAWAKHAVQAAQCFAEAAAGKYGQPMLTLLVHVDANRCEQSGIQCE